MPCDQYNRPLLTGAECEFWFGIPYKVRENDNCVDVLDSVVHLMPQASYQSDKSVLSGCGWVLHKSVLKCIKSNGFNMVSTERLYKYTTYSIDTEIKLY